MEDILKQYGLYGVVVYLIVERLFPQWSSFFISNRSKKMDADLDTMRSQQQIERDSREAERVFRHDIDKRNLEAFERLVISSQQQTNILVTLTERMTQLNINQATLTTFLTESLSSMRERIAIYKKKEL